MTRRQYDELMRLERTVFGEELGADLVREVLWRGWIGRGPAGWLLTPAGAAELELERRRRAAELELARARDR
jgi:hypothetical protein